MLAVPDASGQNGQRVRGGRHRKLRTQLASQRNQTALPTELFGHPRHEELTAAAGHQTRGCMAHQLRDLATAFGNRPDFGA